MLLKFWLYRRIYNINNKVKWAKRDYHLNLIYCHNHAGEREAVKESSEYFKPFKKPAHKDGEAMASGIPKVWLLDWRRGSPRATFKPIEIGSVVKLKSSKINPTSGRTRIWMTSRYFRKNIPSLEASSFGTHDCTYTGNYPWWNIFIGNFKAIGHTNRWRIAILWCGSFGYCSNTVCTSQLLEFDLAK